VKTLAKGLKFGQGARTVARLVLERHQRAHRVFPKRVDVQRPLQERDRLGKPALAAIAIDQPEEKIEIHRS
jgi:hypothetical protein